MSRLFQNHLKFRCGWCAGSTAAAHPARHGPPPAGEEPGSTAATAPAVTVNRGRTPPNHATGTGALAKAGVASAVSAGMRCLAVDRVGRPEPLSAADRVVTTVTIEAIDEMTKRS